MIVAGRLSTRTARSDGSAVVTRGELSRFGVPRLATPVVLTSLFLLAPLAFVLPAAVALSALLGAVALLVLSLLAARPVRLSVVLLGTAAQLSLPILALALLLAPLTLLLAALALDRKSVV